MLYFNIIRKKTLQITGSLDIISLYIPLEDFCIDIPDDGLRKGQNL